MFHSIALVHAIAQGFSKKMNTLKAVKSNQMSVGQMWEIRLAAQRTGEGCIILMLNKDLNPVLAYFFFSFIVR